ncbi:MAG TPA: GntR family transcriptional regulator [Gaiellales bacterium]|nr:GntR family transcriptional regulator [Gaiellales bacterium]
MALTHLTIQQAVADAVRTRVISGQLPAGTRIDQDALAAEFSVSRMPVREALRQLGAEGFVTIVPHRGAIVTALSPAEVEEIYEIRAALEGVAARHASQALTADDLDRLRRVLAAMRNEKQIETWVALNAEFHDGINQASMRPRLLELIQRFREQSQPYIRLYVQRLHKSAQARREHRAILEALARRDADEAEAAVRAHLVGTGRAVAAFARAADDG